VPVLEIEASSRHPVCLQVTDEIDVYPGEEALGSFAQVECLSAFEPFVGVSAFDSSLSYTWIVPSLDGWNKEDDRTVLCVLTNGEDDEDLVGSMRASDR
jgi:hypothetical protein